MNKRQIHILILPYVTRIIKSCTVVFILPKALEKIMASCCCYIGMSISKRV